MKNIEKALSFLEQGNWQAAHELVQDDPSDLSAWAHGIVHMMEGDLANAGYWYQRADRSLPQPADIKSEIKSLGMVIRLPTEQK